MCVYFVYLEQKMGEPQTWFTSSFRLSKEHYFSIRNSKWNLMVQTLALATMLLLSQLCLPFTMVKKGLQELMRVLKRYLFLARNCLQTCLIREQSWWLPQRSQFICKPCHNKRFNLSTKSAKYSIMLHCLILEEILDR